MAKENKEIWRYTIGTDRLRPEELDRVLRIWKDNPANKVVFSGKLRSEFAKWALEQGAKETEDGYFTMSGN